MPSRPPNVTRLRRYLLVVQYDGAPFQGWQRQPGGSTVPGGTRTRTRDDHRRAPGRHRIRTDRHRGARPRTGRGRGRADALVRREAPPVDERAPPPPRSGSGRSAGSRRTSTPGSTRRPAHTSTAWAPRRRRRRPSSPAGAGRVSGAGVDPDRLAEAALLIPGRRSFRRFARTGQPHRGEICEVAAADWTPWDRTGYRFRIEANRYLHRMVRYLVGTMVEIARGRRPLAELAEMLERPDTALRTSRPAPPEGLFLARVEYPPERVGDHPDRDPPSMDFPPPWISS